METLNEIFDDIIGHFKTDPDTSYVISEWKFDYAVCCEKKNIGLVPKDHLEHFCGYYHLQLDVDEVLREYKISKPKQGSSFGIEELNRAKAAMEAQAVTDPEAKAELQRKWWDATIRNKLWDQPEIINIMKEK